MLNLHIQGLPSTRLLEHDIGGKHASTVLACQTDCEAATGCESYQYRSTGNTSYENCMLHYISLFPPLVYYYFAFSCDVVEDWYEG